MWCILMGALFFNSTFSGKFDPSDPRIPLDLRPRFAESTGDQCEIGGHANQGGQLWLGRALGWRNSPELREP